MTEAPSLTDLPSLPLSERSALPDTAAIYFVLAGHTVLYIGQSVSLRQRWVAHHRLAQLNEHGGCRIAWMQVDDVSLLDGIEQACIAHFSPLLNDTVIGARSVRAGEVWIEVRVPQEAKAALDEWAKAAGVSASLIMRRLLVEALASGRGERGELS